VIVPPGSSGRVHIGTSGYWFDDWVGPFYPSGIRKRDMLEYYARRFSCVEINATYYRIPPPSTAVGWVARTPPEFRFIVKAPKSATHERHMLDAEMPAFRDVLAPLQEASKLSGVLLQFPDTFTHGPAALAHIARARAHLSDTPVFCEFRHGSWARDDTFAFLSDRDIGYCAVDEPDLPTLMPPVVRVTSREGYVRFHGRNRGAWLAATRKPGEDRYDYRYSREELAGWVERIRAIANRTQRTWVFFNNCHEGKAVEGAHILADMLKEEIAS
jgi:uncharacterized protein YecE (DUF72 family)